MSNTFTSTLGGSIVNTVDENTGKPVVFTLYTGKGDKVGAINFQNGFDPVVGVNGFAIEDLITIAIKRIEHLNVELPSDFNQAALRNLHTTLSCLNARMVDRSKVL